MTTGHIILDNRTTASLNCGKVAPGTYYSKKWSGGNDPERASPQPYSMQLVEYSDSVIQFGYLPNPPMYTCTNAGLLGLPSAEQLWNSNDDLALVSLLRGKIVGSSFNLGVFLGEGKSTVDLIYQSATKIYGSYRALRRGQLKLALDIALGRNERFNERYNLPGDIVGRHTSSSYVKTGASNHLQVMYGWIPLLNDAKEGAEALARQFSRPKTFRVHVTKMVKGKLTPHVLKSYTGTVYTRANLIAYLTEDGIDLPALHGFADPSQVLWELTPYSFVVDWFLPIGSYLEARGVARALKGTFVTSKKAVVDCSMTPSSRSYSVLGPPLMYKSVNFSRTVSTSLKIPTPEVVPLSKSFSWARAANAVALISQRLFN